MSFLTSRSFITNVNLNNLIHIVDPSDGSQGNPAGSSYKVSIEQIRNFYNQYYVNITGDTMTGSLFTPSFTATTANTNNLVIIDTPTNNPSNFNSLVRNSTTGIVETKDLTHYNFGIFAQTGDSTTVVNTIVETSIIDGGVGSLTIPANGFTIGDSFRLKLGGIVTANNGNSITINVKTGSIILGTDTITFTNGVTNRSWEFNCDFTIRNIGTAGVASIMSNGTFIYNVTSDVYGGGFSTLNNTTFNTTIPNVLEFTVTWGTASANNSIYSSMLILTKTF